MEGRRDIKGEKGVEQERRKGRKKVLKERKKIITLKKRQKKKQACWLQTGQASFAGLFGCSQIRGPSPALLHSLQPSSPAAPGPMGSGTHPPSGYGYLHGAFRGEHSPQCLWSQTPSKRCTLPDASDVCLSPVLWIWA